MKIINIIIAYLGFKSLFRGICDVIAVTKALDSIHFLMDGKDTGIYYWAEKQKSINEEITKP